MSKEAPKKPDEEDEDDVIPSDLVQIVNVSSQMAKFELDGMKYKLRPGQIGECRASYARPMQLQKSADPLPSVVDRETNGRVLCVEDPRAKRVLGNRAAAAMANG